MFLGAPGSDEPHLIPQAGNRKVGSSGPPARAATKKRRVSRAVEAQDGIEMSGDTKAPEDDMCDVETPLGMPSGSATRNARSSSEFMVHRVSDKGDTSTCIDKEFLEGMKAMKSGMEEHMRLMTSFRDNDKLRANMERIKLILHSFPPGTPEHVKALQSLTAMSAMDD
jgi:hypothetical protein